MASTAQYCSSCGAALAPGTRFCRACGAAVDATEPGADPPAGARPADLPPPAPVTPSPPAAAPQPPPPPPPAGQAPPPGPGKKDRRPLLIVLAVLTCILAGGMVAGGVYLLTRDDSSSKPVAKLPPIHHLGGGIGSQPSSPPSESRSTGSGEREQEQEEEPPAEPTSSPGPLSELSPGHYIQAASYRSSEGAETEVERLRGYGVETEAVPAAWANELLPGFWVVLAGPLQEGEEAEVLHRLENAGVSGLSKDLTPSTELAGPEAVAGDWYGEGEETHLRGARRPRSYPVEIRISPSGANGRVKYPQQGCSGSLSLEEDEGYWLTYSELIERGNCTQGGVWSVRLGDEGGLKVAWVQDELQLMVNGELGAF